MLLFVWSDQKYSVGVAQFDEHHKRLVGMINSLFDGMTQGQGQQALSRVLQELLDYTRYHFEAEEVLLERYGYARAAEHKAEHAQLTKRVEAAAQAFHSGQPVLSVDVLDFLRDWLANHITVSDKAYGPFLNAQGIK
jgi:hemerythrin-like metal-binding protein